MDELGSMSSLTKSVLNRGHNSEIFSNTKMTIHTQIKRKSESINCNYFLKNSIYSGT